jgi:hypothetical protein
MSQKSNTLEFYYIGEDELTKIFGFCQPSLDISYQIHLCAYVYDVCYIEGELDSPNTPPPETEMTESNSISDKLATYNVYYPYIKYIMQKNEEGQYDFPRMTYTCPIINEPHKDESSQTIEDAYSLDKSAEQIHFESEIFNFLLSLFKEDTNIHSNHIPIDKIYKGYIEYTETDLFVFYEVTGLVNTLKPEYNECIMDEILYKKKIYNVPIHPIVTDFFKQNFDLTSVRNENGDIMPFPHQLYMCSYTENIYKSLSPTHELQENMLSENATTANAANSTNPTNKVSLFSPFSFQKTNDIVDSMLEPYRAIEHDVLGPCYLFTSELIHENELVNRLPVFIVNCLYVEDILNEMTEEEKVHLKNKLVKSCSVYYHENNLQLWGIRNITHIGNALK